MFVPRIGHLDKTRFGINFKAEDIKCNINTETNMDINKNIFKEKDNKKVR